MTKDEALIIAAKYGLDKAVSLAIGYGYSPDEALADWDILPEDHEPQDTRAPWEEL